MSLLVDIEKRVGNFRLRAAGAFPPAGGEEFRRLRAAGRVPRSGAAYFAHGGKVGKTPLETKVSRLPFFAKDFMK